ncbi:uncharacterized protein VP01_1522g4 [Puccinia sorghi]|uniref:Uncharacterized protein n=1 Tax=Puccinia sorghi TaxID=27349 RepID=A0A0L6VKK7_9BASI|nr:uncharacterized protein VP01_1522g4 [Puccinia sorghi]
MAGWLRLCCTHDIPLLFISHLFPAEILKLVRKIVYHEPSKNSRSFLSTTTPSLILRSLWEFLKLLTWSLNIGTTMNLSLTMEMVDVLLYPQWVLNSSANSFKITPMKFTTFNTLISEFQRHGLLGVLIFLDGVCCNNAMRQAAVKFDWGFYIISKAIPSSRLAFFFLVQERKCQLLCYSPSRLWALGCVRIPLPERHRNSNLNSINTQYFSTPHHHSIPPTNPFSLIFSTISPFSILSYLLSLPVHFNPDCFLVSFSCPSLSSFSQFLYLIFFIIARNNCFNKIIKHIRISQIRYITQACESPLETKFENLNACFVNL